MIHIVKEHTPRKFSTITANTGVVLCADQEGALLVLRFPSEVRELIDILSSIRIDDGEVEEGAHF